MQSLSLAVSNRSSRRWASRRSLLPGLLLTFTIVPDAFELRNFSGITVLSPLIIAIVLSMAFHNTVGTPGTFKPGAVFSMRRILRFAIILSADRRQRFAAMRQDPETTELDVRRRFGHGIKEE